MARKLIIGTAVGALMAAGTAHAFDLSAMNEAEKADFGEAVREYLLQNPEVLVEAMSIYEERQQMAQVAADEALVASNAAALFEDTHSYVGGNPDGDVTIVEFLDYRCGYCKRAHPEVAELLETDGNIRIIVKEFPILGDESVLASRFAVSVLRNEGPEAYKGINDTLMTHRGNFTIESLGKIAEDAGLDADTVLADMESDEVTEVLRQNHALARELQINGTPSFVFGDQMIRGYVPLAGMQEVVAGLREGG